MDSLKGVIFAAFIVALTESFTALYIDPRYVLIAPVAILMVILIVRPWGLFGTVEEFRRVILDYEDKVAELAKDGADVVNPSGAPPFMVLGYAAEQELIRDWRA